MERANDLLVSMMQSMLENQVKTQIFYSYLVVMNRVTIISFAAEIIKCLFFLEHTVKLNSI